MSWVAGSVAVADDESVTGSGQALDLFTRIFDTETATNPLPSLTTPGDWDQTPAAWLALVKPMRLKMLRAWAREANELASMATYATSHGVGDGGGSTVPIPADPADVGKVLTAQAGGIVAWQPTQMPIAGAGLTLTGTTLDVGAGAGISVSADTVAVIYSAVGDLTTVNAGDAASAGVLDKAARGDHQHAVATAAAVAIGTANTEGTSLSLARSDHGHDHGAQAGGSLHALATSLLAGFQSAAHYALLVAATALATPNTLALRDGAGGAAFAGITASAVQITGLGTGVVHSDSTGHLTSSLLLNADVDPNAAIAGTKISPDFGSQVVATTGQGQFGSVLTPRVDATGVLYLGGQSSTTSVEIGRSGQQVLIHGNLVLGDPSSTVNIQATTLDVADRMIHVNDSSGANDPVPTALCGLGVHRGAVSGVARDHAALVWVESSQAWRLGWNKLGDDTNSGDRLPLATSHLRGAPGVTTAAATGLLRFGPVSTNAVDGSGNGIATAAQDGVLIAQRDWANTVDREVVRVFETIGYVRFGDITNWPNAQLAASTSVGLIIGATAVATVISSGVAVTGGISATGTFTLSALGGGIAHVSSAGIFSSSPIVNADVSATAGISGTKVSPDFGSQNVATTGTGTFGPLYAPELHCTDSGFDFYASDNTAVFGYWNAGIVFYQQVYFGEADHEIRTFNRTTSGNGYNLGFVAGAATVANGVGGVAYIRAGAGAGTGGSGYVSLQDGAGVNRLDAGTWGVTVGGDIYFQPELGDRFINLAPRTSTGRGYDLGIIGANALGGNNAGGKVYLRPGAATGSGAIGYLSFQNAAATELMNVGGGAHVNIGVDTFLTNGSAIYPLVDNQGLVGGTANRFNQVHATNIVAHGDATNTERATLLATSLAFVSAGVNSFTLTSGTSLIYNVATSSVHQWRVNNVALLQMDSGNLYPATDQSLGLGGTGNRWASIHGTTLAARNDTTNTQKATLSYNSLISTVGMTLEGAGATTLHCTAGALTIGSDAAGIVYNVALGGFLHDFRVNGVSEWSVGNNELTAGIVIVPTSDVSTSIGRSNQRFNIVHAASLIASTASGEATKVTLAGTSLLGTGALTITAATASTWSVTTGSPTINGSTGVILQYNGTDRFTTTNAGNTSRGDLLMQNTAATRKGVLGSITPANSSGSRAGGWGLGFDRLATFPLIAVEDQTTDAAVPALGIWGGAAWSGALTDATRKSGDVYVQINLDYQAGINPTWLGSFQVYIADLKNFETTYTNVIAYVPIQVDTIAELTSGNGVKVAGCQNKLGTLQTTNATSTAVPNAGYTFAASTKIVMIETMVKGLKSDGTAGAGLFRRGTFRRNSSGTVVQVGTTTTVDHEDNASTDCTLTINGTSVDVKVVGIAAETWNWKAVTRIVPE